LDLAVVLLESKQLKKSVTLLEKLLKLEPKNSSVAYNLAVALRRQGAMKKAYENARVARQLNPGGSDELLLEARMLLELGEAQDALTLLDTEKAPASHARLFVRARALRMRGRLPDALNDARSAEKLGSNTEERHAARRLQGKVLTDLGRGAEAIGMFREKGADPLELGIALSRAGRGKEAVALLGRYVRAKGDDVEAYLAYAASLQAVGRQAQALRILTQARGRWPRHGGLINDTALAWLARGKKKRAVALLEQGVLEAPGHPSLVRNMARHLVATRRRRQAIAMVRKATSLRPHEGKLHTALGELLMGAKRIEEARSSFRLALEAGTPDLRAKARLGDLLRREGKLEAAIKLYRAALAVRPGMLEAHNGLGMSLHGLERFDEAIAQYHRGLVHAPGDPELNNNLGSTFYLKGRFPSALKAFERATQSDASEVMYWRNQIMVLKEQGRLDHAQKVLQAALKRHPGHASLNNEALSLARAKEVRARMATDPDNGVRRPSKAPR
jgi:Flp pilus assembly protein TadD